ncbi:MAG: nuclear transport factor 2 family protein [Deltaproteobacteria bacterium]|nr:nuclear transport factor 2 family protein [Deltaproteobacteria bacterium]
MRIAAIVVVVLCGTAAADEDIGTPSTSGEGVVYRKGKPPRFALSGAKAHVSPASTEAALDGADGLGDKTTIREVTAMAADKKAYWIAGDVAEFVIGCGSAPCPPPPPPPPTEYHSSFLWQLNGTDWDMVAWNIAPVVTGKQQAAAIKNGAAPSAIAKRIDAGAEDVVKLFETSIADPKSFAATVSTRKDVVLYGNEPAERTVGGAKVKAKLEAWKLGFKVRDGIQAGVTSSKTVAWVAANVDSTSAKKPKDKPVPYRVLALYEKSGKDWKLVHANFAYIP